MKKIYEVQLSRVVREYRIVLVEADTEGQARSRARKLSNEDVEPSSREYVTDWCDADYSDHHRIVQIQEKK